MNIGLDFRQQIEGVPGGSWVVQALGRLTGSIEAGYHTQHSPADTHSAVTCDSITSNAGAGTFAITDAGAATFGGQPRVRLYATARSATPGSFETRTWARYSSAIVGASPLLWYDPQNLFDGTSAIACAGLGLYVARASWKWAAKAAAGTVNKLQIVLTTPGGNEIVGIVETPASAVAQTQYIAGSFSLPADGAPYTVKVQTYFDDFAYVSNGFDGESWFEVTKIA